MPAALNSAPFKATTVSFVKYKSRYITSLLKPSSGCPSYKNQIQTFAMALKTPQDQPAANILSLISHQLQPMGFLSVPQTGQVPWNHNTGPLHLLFPYLNCFLQMVIWLVPCHHSKLNSNTTSSEHLAWSPPFKAPLWHVLVTCLCISCLIVYWFSPLAGMQTAWEQRLRQVHNCLPSAWNSAQEVCDQYLLNELTIHDENEMCKGDGLPLLRLHSVM